MKIISLYQPWATFLCLGLKKYETRSWSTSARGDILIHAGKKAVPITSDIQDIMTAYGMDYNNPKDFPRGAIVGRVHVDSIHRTEHIVERATYDPDFYRNILPLGDYEPGRFAWKCKDEVNFKKPVPCRGFQGIWNAVNKHSLRVETFGDRHFITYYDEPVFKFKTSESASSFYANILFNKNPLLTFPTLLAVHKKLFK